jgi:hypothetical protein
VTSVAQVGVGSALRAVLADGSVGVQVTDVSDPAAC